jgi:nucleoid DNA-binding protein
MNKLELIEALRKETGLNKFEAAVVVDMFFGEMANALAKGDRVEIRGLCSFSVTLERHQDKKVVRKSDGLFYCCRGRASSRRSRFFK